MSRLAATFARTAAQGRAALVAFAATVLTRKAALLDDVGHLLLPLLPVTALVCWLVMRQPDLGTTVILAGTIFALLFVAGVRLRYLGLAGIAGVAIGWILMLVGLVGIGISVFYWGPRKRRGSMVRETVYTEDPTQPPPPA